MRKMHGKKRAVIEEFVEKNNLSHLWAGAPPTKIKFDWRRPTEEIVVKDWSQICGE